MSYLSHAKFLYLKLKNLFSKHSFLDSNSIFLISMTSYGERLNTAFYAIESIANGVIKPRRIILWISYKDSHNIPVSIRRLEKRGLEVKYCEDLKSYKKLIPLISLRNNLDGIQYIVTADDDLVYPDNWLLHFDINCTRPPDKYIYSQRARRVIIKNAQLDKYYNWPLLNETITNTSMILATGAGGIAYPISFLEISHSYGNMFLKLAPHQDDIWFWGIAKVNGFKQCYLHNKKQFRVIAGTISTSLWKYNSIEDKNSRSPNDLALDNILKQLDIDLTNLD